MTDLHLFPILEQSDIGTKMLRHETLQGWPLKKVQIKPRFKN